MDEDMWLAAADYLPSSNSKTKPQHLQAAGRASGDESEDDDDNNNSKTVFASPSSATIITRADAEQSIVGVGVGGANLRARRPSSLVSPSTPSSPALLDEEADDEDDEDDTIPATVSGGRVEACNGYSEKGRATEREREMGTTE
jgi:hypothetical protein